MDKKLSEKEIVSYFDAALKNNRLYVCYQPQVNYTNYRVVGAEALLRWDDPQNGLQYPADFIPVLENNDLVSKADLFVFEEVCKMQRKCLDQGIHAVPVSVNLSGHELNSAYVDSIESIRRKYDIPVYYLRIEIRESFAYDGVEKVTPVLEKLRTAGYVLVLDDFGMGYASLNILKDLNADVIKLDMSFLYGDVGVRGGKIINSLVQMAKWLNTPVIAEKVDTLDQADFMQSIGCYYIQGNLFMEPSGEQEYLEKLKEAKFETISFNYKSFGAIQDNSFWNPGSVESLLFNRFLGPAGLVIYRDGEITVLRVNRKYIEELGMQLNEKSILNMNPWNRLFPEDKERYEKVLKETMKTFDEGEIETWRSLTSDCCGEDLICIRSNIQYIGTMSDQNLFFVSIRNVTREKESEKELSDDLKKFIMASDQNNTFSWEYDVLTHDMRPCSRCRRILGLPALLKNYPEPVIESGLFPEDYADLYRDWHRQLAEGAKSLDGIIPLTGDRVPFHVRYTAEFDENGRPYKAYGSATQVEG